MNRTPNVPNTSARRPVMNLAPAIWAMFDVAAWVPVVLFIRLVLDWIALAAAGVS